MFIFVDIYNKVVHIIYFSMLFLIDIDLIILFKIMKLN